MSKANVDPLPADAILTSMHRPRIPLRFLFGASYVCAVASVLFGFFYYALYWRYRGLFNEDGRYLDPRDLVVHHAQDATLAVPACGFALLAIVLFVFGRIHRRLEMETP
jgi:hypothetical protein